MGRAGKEALELPIEAARALCQLAVERAAAAGAPWEAGAVEVQRQSKLQKVLEEAFSTSLVEEP